jgi:hypothetical protein
MRAGPEPDSAATRWWTVDTVYIYLSVCTTNNRVRARERNACSAAVQIWAASEAAGAAIVILAFGLHIQLASRHASRMPKDR